MHLINRDTDYAIRILKLISRNPEHTHDARTLSQELGMPRPFLRKILQRLGNKGLLLSSRGRNGGFGLGRPAGSIFINDLLLLRKGKDWSIAMATPSPAVPAAPASCTKGSKKWKTIFKNTLAV